MLAVRASGYRLRSGAGAHFWTFQALEVAIGPDVATLVAYFNRCRQHRNDVMYGPTVDVSHADAADLVRRVVELRRIVENWIARRHPALRKAPRR